MYKLRPIHNKNFEDDYKDHYIATTDYILLELFKAGWILTVAKYFYHQLEKKSDSSDILSLCRYHYNCGVDSVISFKF